MPTTTYENLQKLSEGPKVWSYGTSQVSRPGPGVPAPATTPAASPVASDADFITQNIKWLSRPQLTQIVSWIKERHPSS